MIYILDKEEEKLLTDDDGELVKCKSQEDAYNAFIKEGYSHEGIVKSFSFLKSLKILEPVEIPNIEVFEIASEVQPDQHKVRNLSILIKSAVDKRMKEFGFFDMIRDSINDYEKFKELEQGFFDSFDDFELPNPSQSTPK